MIVSSLRSLPPPPLPQAEAVWVGYYNATTDGEAVRRYYRGLEAPTFEALHDLVSGTHHPVDYAPGKRLYDWVDLRETMRLESLYEPRREKPVLHEKAAAWAEALEGAPMDAPEIARRLAGVESRDYYNCEHVVPQSWFGKREPMRGDLHHLFACERTANSDRGSMPLGEAFQPGEGRGEAARASLYFLLRYPGQARGVRPSDVRTMLRWHSEDPPSVHELHRNRAIQEQQGNRNPFVDHPEWAGLVDFSRALS